MNARDLAWRYWRAHQGAAERQLLIDIEAAIRADNDSLALELDAALQIVEAEGNAWGVSEINGRS